MVAALHSRHGEASAAVLEQSLGAIRSLSFDNAANITKLIEAGACSGESLIKLGAFSCFEINLDFSWL